MSLPAVVAIFARRQRRVAIAVFVAVLGTVALVTALLPERYRADATLVVGGDRSVTVGGSVQADEVLARTYAELLDAADTKAAVRAALPFRVVGSLGERIDVRVVTGTQLVRVTAEDGRPDRAQILADTYVTTFARRQADTAAQVRGDQADALEDRIGTVAAEVARLKAGVDPAALAQAETRLQAARDAYSAAQEDIALRGADVAVASRAARPTSPSAPRPLLYLAMGVLIALGLAATAALIADRFDDRFRDEDELTAAAGAPVLARVPRRGGDQRAVREAYDVLCSNLRAADPAGDRRLLLVTSAMAGEGKSFTVMRLAEAFARREISVLAIDGDLRRPTLPAAAGVQSPKGVSNLLVEEARDPRDLVIASASPGVALLPAGPRPPHPAALLSTKRLRTLVMSLRRAYDVVLVDSPPVPAGADTTALGGAVDGAILVADLDRARRRALRTTLAQLERAGVEVVGVVLNQVRGWDRDQYGYYGPSAGETATVTRLPPVASAR